MRYGQDAVRLETSLTSALARGDGVLVYDDGETKGLAWFVPDGTLGLGGYLRLLAVVPGAEGKGVGRALLRAFEHAVFAVSAHAFLLCSDFNTDARRFYGRQGYSEVGGLPDLVLSGVTEVILWKRRPH